MCACVVTTVNVSGEVTPYMTWNLLLSTCENYWMHYFAYSNAMNPFTLFLTTFRNITYVLLWIIILFRHWCKQTDLFSKTMAGCLRLRCVWAGNAIWPECKCSAAYLVSNRCLIRTQNPFHYLVHKMQYTIGDNFIELIEQLSYD